MNIDPTTDELKAIRAELTSQSAKIANLASDRFCSCVAELMEVKSLIDQARKILIDQARKILFDLES